MFKNVTINNGDLFNAKTKKMSILPRKKLFECLGVVPEQGKKIDLSTNVFWAKIFHDDLFIILTKRRQLLISIDGNNFSEYGPFKDKEKGHVTCVTYYANVFAMGFSSGDIWLFFIRGTLDFYSMDFDKPNVTFKVGEIPGPITSIDINLGLAKEEIILICSCDNETYVFRL